LARLSSETFDVLVIGGGITGAGVLLDAAARGLRAGLVEARDFASGTSSRSSKLIHGGLRYLQQREFRLVYEALAERQRLLVNAPHLVSPLPFLIPLFGRQGVARSSLARLYSVALWQYDLTGGLRIGKRHRRVPTRTTPASP
jgi:glycerol-3-phosphate dehydrogenase